MGFDQAILIQNDMMGGPDETLGRILMGNFVRLLSQREGLPAYIVLINGGLRLAVKGAEALEHLQRLQQLGVKIVISRTCVDYFDIEKDIAIGEIDGMVRIMDILSSHAVVTV